jgi:hypothetical protein
MKSFTVTHAGRESSEPFSNYLFDVTDDGRKVAELSHDFRGDEHWIRLPGDRWAPYQSESLRAAGSSRSCFR